MVKLPALPIQQAFGDFERRAVPHRDALSPTTKTSPKPVLVTLNDRVPMSVVSQACGFKAAMEKEPSRSSVRKSHGPFKIKRPSTVTTQRAVLP
jgi:hypothetical protein